MFSLFCNGGPSGLSADGLQQAQTRLQNDDEHLPTLTCKRHGCFTEKWFPIGFC